MLAKIAASVGTTFTPSAWLLRDWIADQGLTRDAVLVLLGAGFPSRQGAA